PGDLGVVAVVVVVGAVPDARRVERQQAEYRHDGIGQPRPAEDGAVLVIVIDNEQANNDEPGNDAEREPEEPMDGQERCRQQTGQGRQGGPQVVPAEDPDLPGERLGGFDQVCLFTHNLYLSASFTYCTLCQLAGSRSMGMLGVEIGGKSGGTSHGGVGDKSGDHSRGPGIYCEDRHTGWPTSNFSLLYFNSRLSSMRRSAC